MRKQFPIHLLVFIFICIFFRVTPNAYALELKVGVYQNSPKVFLNDKGDVQGIFIDLMNEIAHNHGWDIEYVFGTWNENLNRLENGEIDVLLDVAYSEERAQRFVLNSVFVIDDWLEAFTLKGTSIESVNCLDGKRIAVVRGSIQDHYMRREVKDRFSIDYDLVVLPDYPSTVMATLSGEVDAIVASRFFFFSNERDEGIRSTAIILRPSQVYFAFPKDQEKEIISAIDKSLVEFKNNPNSVLYKSLDRWLSPPSKVRYPKYLVWVLYALVLVVTIVLAFLVFLRHQVKQRTLEAVSNNKELKEVNSKLKHLVTKYQNTEQELIKFRFMVENARQEVYLVRYNGDIAYVNKATSESLGYSIEEILEGGIKLFDPNYGKKYEEHFNELKEKEVPPFETIHYTKDGRKLYKRVKSFLLRINSSEFVCGFAEDITEQKRAQRALYNSKKLFQSLAEMSPVGIFRTRADGYTTFVNPKWMELSGLPFKDALGDGWLKAVHPEDKEKVSRQWEERTLKGLISEAEYRFMKSDGSIIWVLGDAVPELDGEDIVGYIGTITDITDRKVAELLLKEKSEEIEAQNEEYKQLNRELEVAKNKAVESDRLKTAFLANMSHEIRTPMNAICGFSKLLARQNLDNERKEQYIDIINSNSQQLLGIISDIIDISKIESGLVSVSDNPIQINSLLDDLYQTYRGKFRAMGVEFLCRKGLPNSRVHVEGDEVKIKQILSNLLTNAMKHTAKGVVDFGYVLKDDKLLFHVKDTGIGIPKDLQPNIFERFYQVEGAITDSRRGTGLGLPISKAFVQILGGEIWVESDVNKGAAFYFTIPYKVLIAEEIERPIEVSLSVDWTTKRILICEDDYPNYYYLRETLNETGAEVIHVTSGEGAIKMCEQDSNIDIVLMDIKLPKMDGFTATQQIRKKDKKLPIIAQTAYAYPADDEKAMKAGCNAFLAKPIDREALLSVLSKYLG